MEEAIQKFIKYCHKIKKSSENTEVSYRRDLEKLKAYLTENCRIEAWSAVTSTHLNSYILSLEEQKYAASSISRASASMKAFFAYLEKKDLIAENPAEMIKPPKIEKKAPHVMAPENVEKILNQPSPDTPKGLRDLAMLELLYATGMRVSELIDLKVDDVNLAMNYLTCIDRKSERIIPFGKAAKEKLTRYLEEGRPSFVGEKKTDYLFTNYSGGRMSRQGFWKVLKGYAEAAGIEEEITPHTFRHSFAAHMIQNGADLKSVQEMMGHSDISTTAMYRDLALSRMQEVYAHAHPHG